MKSNKAALYIGLVFLVGLVILGTYFMSTSAVKTVPRITLSYFPDQTALADAIHSRLQQELKTAPHVWIGFEPEKVRHEAVAVAIKDMVEKNYGPFDLIVVDQQLNTKSFPTAEVFPIKEAWFKLGEKIKAYSDKRVLVITASIYSTNLLKDNTLDKVTKMTGLRPMTFSTSYFAINNDDEKNNLFPCNTEDNTGVRDWSCLTLNKARVQRRKINLDKLKEPKTSWLGLMDLSGEKDYIILLK